MLIKELDQFGESRMSDDSPPITMVFKCKKYSNRCIETNIKFIIFHFHWLYHPYNGQVNYDEPCSYQNRVNS